VDGRRRLRQIVATGDVAALAAAAAVVLGIAALFSAADTHLAGAILGGLVAVRTQGLWDGHRSSVRSLELAGLVRAAVAIAVTALLLDRLVGLDTPLPAAAGIAVAGLVSLLAWRSALRMWVAANRARGRFVQRTLVIGTDRRAAELVRLGEVHPEAGVRYVGVVGNRFEAEAAGIGNLWVGEIADVIDLLDRSSSIDRVVVCAGAGGSLDVATLLGREQLGGPEVVVHAGLPGIDASRITVSAVANEALLRVAPATRSVTAGLLNRFVKRAFDIVVAAALLLVAAPVFALVAILVKREDGGPVLFRQERVGRDGVGFGMVKFRTMVVDAEARLAAVQGDNQRSGPLFKLAVDPRVTRIGHILRRTSLDELPQLPNVLKGEMSLVGPRPALQREVDEFPTELHARHQVRPGITGLWQVEARDNPAFDAYQRLDLFYVANASLLLDVVVLLGTAEQMLLRPFQSKRRGEMVAAQAAAETPSFVAAA
jgi:exopolysaccharide biosynthesis polyprenyl glycosylphosphotransferase